LGSYQVISQTTAMMPKGTNFLTLAVYTKTTTPTLQDHHSNTAGTYAKRNQGI